MRVLRILKRIKRNLGDLADKYLDQEILDEMQEAQKTIIVEARCLEQLISISSQKGEKYYELKFVSLIKCVKYDEKELELKSGREFELISSEIGHSSIPLIAAYLNDTLMLCPPPQESDKEIKVLAFLSNSSKPIARNYDPEIPENFDKAIEYFATAQFLQAPEKFNYLQMYQVELKKYIPHQHLKNTLTQVGGNW